MKRIYALCIAALTLFNAQAQNTGTSAIEDLRNISVDAAGSNFQYWNQESESFKALTDFVKTVTTEGNQNYVPAEDRIAVFDMDGTIYSETLPRVVFVPYWLDRVLADENPMPTTHHEEALCLRNLLKTVGNITDAEKDSIKVWLIESTEGWTMHDEIMDLRHWADTSKVQGMENLTYAEAFFIPMIEVWSYLESNQFTCFIISASDVEQGRALLANIRPFPYHQCVGTNALYDATGNTGGKTPTSYTLTGDDRVVRSGKVGVVDKNLQKVLEIVRCVGKQPILAWGNSSGDFSMLQYAINEHDEGYQGIAFCNLCDDTEREHGKPSVAEKTKTECEARGFIPVSMKDDWTKIYGGDAKRTDIAPSSVAKVLANPSTSTQSYTIDGKPARENEKGFIISGNKTFIRSK